MSITKISLESPLKINPLFGVNVVLVFACSLFLKSATLSTASNLLLIII